MDIVGERWALLIARELLLGPKRFTDLRAGISHASPNVLAQRLRELERYGVVRRRKLGPPSGARVYELTEWGLELELVLRALGRWGIRSPFMDTGGAVSSDSLMLALRSLFAPDDSDWSAVYELRFGEDRFRVAVADGEIEVARGEVAAPDAVVGTDPATFAGLLTGQLSVRSASGGGQLELTGDVDAVERLFGAIRIPAPAPVPAPV